MVSTSTSCCGCQTKCYQGGKLPEELTNSAHPHSDEWSEEDLPEILFYLKPPKSEFEGKPVQLLKENGQLVKVWGENRPLKDFPILPRRIALDVPGWMVEAWRRLDPRITYGDILDRQIADPAKGLKKLDKNALQNHCGRECRRLLGLWMGYDRRTVPHRTHVEAIESLSYQNIMLNTVLNVCPGRQDRLTKVRFVKRSLDGEGRYYAELCEVDETNVGKTTFPIDHFVLKSETTRGGVHKMDDGMLAAWELSLILQERAQIHGFNHWKKLADSCRPVTWFDRTAKKRTANDTFDGGCAVCTWVPGRDQLLHKEWMDAIKASCNEPGKRKLSATKGSTSQVSKKRKLEEEKKEHVSKETKSESAEDCPCCQEAASTHDSGSSSEQYPSERFRSGQIVSFFRDADSDSDSNDEAMVESVADSHVEHSFTEERREGEQAAEHNGASVVNEQSTKHSGGVSGPYAAEWEEYLNSNSHQLTTIPLPSYPDFNIDDYYPAYPDLSNIDL